MPQERESTILFSDLRDFTEYNFHKGDQQAFHLLRICGKIARKHIHLHQGSVVKTYGDGIMACFQEPVSAVLAAIELQKGFLQHSRNCPQDPLLVGIGLHTGHVIEENNDVFGHAVNMAKRIADEARCCQILATQAVIERLNKDASIPWLVSGDRNIKGVGITKLYEISWRNERQRPTTKNHRLNLALTENHELVIEAGNSRSRRQPHRRSPSKTGKAPISIHNGGLDVSLAPIGESSPRRAIEVGRVLFQRLRAGDRMV